MRAGQCSQQSGQRNVPQQPGSRTVLTQMKNSGNTDSLVMGLLLKAMVATGARARNSRIFLASSGSLENAMNAGK